MWQNKGKIILYRYITEPRLINNGKIILYRHITEPRLINNIKGLEQ
jgi:hypothetical protein